MISGQTPMQGNSAVLVIQEGPYTFEKRASQEVLASVMKNEFFETLRTKQQTAYIAKAWEKEEAKRQAESERLDGRARRHDLREWKYGMSYIGAIIGNS